MQTAAKVLSNDPNNDELKTFYDEAIMMGMLAHTNIVSLLGIITCGHPKAIVMELCDNGDLHHYLQELSSRMAQASENFLLAAGVGVARGMEYLQLKSIVHRDLAARNVLLDQTYSVKVCDFGLSRCVGAQNDGDNVHKGLYKMTHGANIPVRWTSPEALRDQEYTHKSDVWSYGIVLWEIWTNANTPYDSMTNEQVWLEVGTGYRLPKPQAAPAFVYDIMRKSWSANVSERPDFVKIITDLHLLETSKQLSEGNKLVISSALGAKIEEEKSGKVATLGLSAHHINNVVKKFMKVSKAMTTTDVLSRMKKILKNEGG